LNFHERFRKILKYQISWKSVQWEPSCSMRKDGRFSQFGESFSKSTELRSGNAGAVLRKLNIYGHRLLSTFVLVFCAELTFEICPSAIDTPYLPFSRFHHIGHNRYWHERKFRRHQLWPWSLHWAPCVNSVFFYTASGKSSFTIVCSWHRRERDKLINFTWMHLCTSGRKLATYNSHLLFVTYCDQRKSSTVLSNSFYGNQYKPEGQLHKILVSRSEATVQALVWEGIYWPSSCVDFKLLSKFLCRFESTVQDLMYMWIYWSRTSVKVTYTNLLIKLFCKSNVHQSTDQALL
jgi:hypothetical protein